MIQCRLWSGFFLVCVLLGCHSAGRAKGAGEGEAVPPLSRQQIEQIVHDYLLREPEVLFRASQEYERRRREKAVVDARHAVVSSRATLTDAAAPSIGSQTPKVTLVEFFDFRCVYCRRMVPIIDQIVKENPDIRVVLKDHPILGPDSLTASTAVLAARRQRPDRYYDLYQALMRSSDLSEPSVIGIAGSLGLDTDQLRRDMGSAEVKAELEANGALAKSLGVTGTPAFVLGDTVIASSLSKPDLARRIEEVRRSCVGTC